MNIEEIQIREKALEIYKELRILRILEDSLTEEGIKLKAELEEFVFNNAELIFD